MRPDNDETMGITFTVRDVQAPILAFSQMLKRGYGCSLSSENMELQRGNHFKIPIHRKGHRFYLRPLGFILGMGDCHSISVLTYQETPLQMNAPSYYSTTVKRVSGGITDNWELFTDRGILRRVHKRPRVFLFVPENRLLPASITLNDCTGKRHTIFQLPNGERKEIHDDWNAHQTRIQDLN